MIPALPTLLALALAQVPPAAPGAPGAADAPDAAQQAAPAPELPEGDAAARIPTRRYVVERVEVRGLSHTRPEAIRRHVLVDAGELLDPERVLLSRLGLLQLGWFSRVETHVERGSERGQVVVVFDVTERNTLVLTDLIIGSTKPQPIYGGLGLSQQNFLGRGLGLSGAAVYGGSPEGRHNDPDRYALRAGFFAPDLPVPRLRLVAGVSGLFLRGEELSCADVKCEAYRASYGLAPHTRYQRAGGEVVVGLRPGPFERLSATYRLERIRATRVGLAEGEGPYVRSGDSTLASLTGGYEVDTRDDFFYPTEGFHAQGQVTFASRLAGGDYEYSRYLLQGETAFSLARLPVRFQLALGAVQGDAPFFDRFYPADFSYFAIGPALGRALELNFSTDSRYDAALAMAGLEYGLPLWSWQEGPIHRAYLAIGTRAVFSSARPGGKRTAFSKTPLSADLALRLDTLIGTFNVSLGYALDNAL